MLNELLYIHICSLIREKRGNNEILLNNSSSIATRLEGNRNRRVRNNSSTRALLIEIKNDYENNHHAGPS